MVGPADFPALAKENPSTVRIEGELVKPTGHRVRFNSHSGEGPGMEHIRCRDQHTQRGVRGEENTMVTVQQAVGGRRHVGVKFDVPEVAIFVGPVPLMTYGLQREAGAARFVEHV